MLDKIVAVSGVPKWMVRSSMFATLWHFCFVFSVTVTKSGTNALFLARSNPRLLPFLYVGVSGAILLITFTLSRTGYPSRRSDGLRRIVWATVIIGIGLLALAQVTQAATLMLYLVGEIQATLVSVLFWSRIGSTFDIRDQKKIIGMIASGGMAGAVLGGLLLHWQVEAFGVSPAMFVSWVILLLAMPALNNVRTSKPVPVHNEKAPFQPAIEYFFTHRYPLAIALLVMLYAATGAAVDFVFRIESAALYTQETQLASLFGILNSWVGVATSIFQFFVTSRLLSFAGVFAFAAIVPTALLLLSGLRAFFFAEAFAILAIIKGVEMAGAFSLNGAAVALLYNPIPAAIRPQLRTLIDGSVKKLGAAISGLALGGLAIIQPAFINIWLVGTLSAVTIVFLPVIRYLYLRALDQKIGLKKSKLIRGEIDLTDKATYSMLKNMLNSEDPARVLAAMDIMGETLVLDDALIKTLFARPDEQIRIQALRHLPNQENPAMTSFLQSIVEQKESRRIRAEAIRSLPKVAKRDHLALVVPYLEDEEPSVVTAAIEVCMQSSNEGPARVRLNSLVENIEQLDARWRRELARLLHVFAQPSYDHIISRLRDDPEISVRRLAVQAMGRERLENHLDELIPLLANRELRFDVRTSLVQFGDAAVEPLAHILDDRTVSLEIRMHIPRVLSQIGSEAAAQALLFSNTRDDAGLQQRISHRLAQIHKRFSLRSLDKERTVAAITRRLIACSTYAKAYRELNATSDPVYLDLSNAVRERRNQNLGLAFQLLGLHHDMDRMMHIYRTWIAAPNHSLAQDALELLDVSLVGETIRQDLLQLMEETPPPIDDAEISKDRVKSLCRSRDPILRGIARRTLRLLGEQEDNSIDARMHSAEAVELEGEDMAEDVIETMLLLQHVDLFEGLSHDDLASIASICEEVEFPPNAQIYAEGEIGDCLYVIIDGRVTAFRGDQKILEFGPGESLGQVSFLDQQARPVTAKVGPKAKARFLLIERRAFLDLLTDRPGLMHAFFAVLGARIRTIIDRQPD